MSAASLSHSDVLARVTFKQLNIKKITYIFFNMWSSRLGRTGGEIAGRTQWGCSCAVLGAAVAKGWLWVMAGAGIPAVQAGRGRLDLHKGCVDTSGSSGGGGSVP